MLSKKGGIGCRFDLANVGLIGVSGLALAGAASTLTPPIDARNSRAGVLWWRPDEAQGQRLEVLRDRGEVELVSGTG